MSESKKVYEKELIENYDAQLEKSYARMGDHVIKGDPFLNVMTQEQFQDRVAHVFKLLADILSKSFGAYGAPSIIVNPSQDISYTKDGWTIAKNVTVDTHLGSSVDLTIYRIVTDICGRLNYRVGDGTTTAIMATNAIYKSFMDFLTDYLKEHNIRPRDVINTMKEIAVMIEKGIREEAVPIQGTEDMLEKVRNIVKISTNDNAELTDFFVKVVKEVGAPIINCSVSKSLATKMEIIDGYRAPIIYGDKMFVTNEQGEGIYSTVDVIIFDHIVGNTAYTEIIKPLAEYSSNLGRQLLVIAPHYDAVTVRSNIARDIAEYARLRTPSKFILAVAGITGLLSNKYLFDLAMLLNTTVIDQNLEADIIQTTRIMGIDHIFNINMRGIRGINIAVEKDDRLASVTDDGTYFTDKKISYSNYRQALDSGVTPEDTSNVKTFVMRLGYVDSVTITDKTSMFQGFYFDQPTYEKYLLEAKIDMDELVEEYAQLATYSLDVVAAQSRYNALKLRLASIEVGGESIMSRDMIKDTVDDAIHATESAFTHGYILGCNVTTIRVINKLIHDLSLCETSVKNELSIKILESIRDGFIEVYRAVLRNAFDDIEVKLNKSVIEQCFSITKGETVAFMKIHMYDAFPYENYEEYYDTLRFGQNTPYTGIFVFDYLMDFTYNRGLRDKAEFVNVSFTDIIIGISLMTNQVFDLDTMKFNSNVINSANTDIEVMKATNDLMSILINGNQVILTNTHNFNHGE